MNRSIHYVLLCLLAAGGMISCTKKVDFSYDNRPVTSAVNASSTRIVNIRSALELMIDTSKLTSFLQPDYEGNYGPGQTRATIFFPTTGRMGLTYNIDQRFVDTHNMINNVRFASFSNSWGLNLTRPFTIKDDYNHPMDYYFTFFSPNVNGNTDSLFAVPRSVSSPAAPDRFKIRLLNLSSDGYANKGAMQLVWANGMPVAGIGSVAVGAYSDYVELPYGSYQFRVLAENGVQVPGVGGSSNQYNVIDPTSATILLPSNFFNSSINGFDDSKLTYAPLKTFQPGGVYTIVVADCPNFRYSNGGTTGETYSAKQNAFRIIADVEPQNITYARVQAVNVLPGKKIKVQVDGAGADTSIAFAVASGYDRFITGTHTLKVMDDAGTLLSTQSFLLSPGDNLSAWVYADATGKPAVSMVANNLSSVIVNPTGEDGTYSSGMVEFLPWVRFLNFCADLPEATFTRDNGQLFSAASQHLRVGVPAINSPYELLHVDFYHRILAYASQPDVLPGDELRNITALNSRQFIANTALYGTSALPYSEPGIYTVALVGTIDASKPGTEKARMIIIKHNQ